MNLTMKESKKRNPEKTRETILDVALNLVSEKGVDALSMSTVAIEAGVSRTAVYKHFKDKDDLFKQLKEWVRHKHSALVVEGEYESLLDSVLATTKLTIKNPELTRLISMDLLYGGESVDMKDSIFKTTLERIEGGQKDGSFSKDLDPEVATFIHMGAMAATLMYAAHHPSENIDELAEKYAKNWCRYLQGKVVLEYDDKV